MTGIFVVVLCLLAQLVYCHGNNIETSKSGSLKHTYKLITYSDEASSFWVDLAGKNKSATLLPITSSPILVNLSFEFPFRGREWRDVLISRYGYLQFKKVKATEKDVQYIWPLYCSDYAIFDEKSKVIYHDDGSSLRVQWDHMSTTKSGKTNVYNSYDSSTSHASSFQAILQKDGDITFVYQGMMNPLSDIKSHWSSPTVGLSSLPLIYNGRNKVNLTSSGVGRFSAIYFKAPERCNAFESCESCAESPADFGCFWCPTNSICTDMSQELDPAIMYGMCHNYQASECPSASLTYFSRNSSGLTSRKVSITAENNTVVIRVANLTNLINATNISANQTVKDLSADSTSEYALSINFTTIGLILMIIVTVVLIGWIVISCIVVCNNATEY